MVIKGPPKTISVEDSFRACGSWAAVDAVLAVLAPDLLRLLDEEADISARRPRTLTVRWRLAGRGWARIARSCPMPAAALDARSDLARRAAVLASAARRVLGAGPSPGDKLDELRLLNLAGGAFEEAKSPAHSASLTAGWLVQPAAKQSQAGEPPGARQSQAGEPPGALLAPGPTASAASTAARRDYRRDHAALVLPGPSPAIMSKSRERTAREVWNAGPAIVRDSSIQPTLTCDVPAAAAEDDGDFWEGLGDVHGLAARAGQMPAGQPTGRHLAAGGLASQNPVTAPAHNPATPVIPAPSLDSKVEMAAAPQQRSHTPRALARAPVAELVREAQGMKPEELRQAQAALLSSAATPEEQESLLLAVRLQEEELRASLAAGNARRPLPASSVGKSRKKLKPATSMKPLSSYFSK